MDNEDQHDNSDYLHAWQIGWDQKNHVVNDQLNDDKNRLPNQLPQASSSAIHVKQNQIVEICLASPTQISENGERGNHEASAQTQSYGGLSPVANVKRTKLTTEVPAVAAKTSPKQKAPPSSVKICKICNESLKESRLCRSCMDKDETRTLLANQNGTRWAKNQLKMLAQAQKIRDENGKKVEWDPKNPFYDFMEPYKSQVCSWNNAKEVAEMLDRFLGKWENVKMFTYSLILENIVDVSPSNVSISHQCRKWTKPHQKQNIGKWVPGSHYGIEKLS